MLFDGYGKPRGKVKFIRTSDRTHTYMKLTFNLAGALYSEKLRKITKKYGKLLSVAKFDERKKMRRNYFSINTV